jgi:hypothetical protein
MEMEFYCLFCQLLNKTLTKACVTLAFKAGLKTKEKLFYDSLCFSTFNRPVNDGINGAHPLKPDMIDCTRRICTKDDVWLYNILIPCEVKGEWADLVMQMGTYAHCIFACSYGKHYILVIGLNHRLLECQFLFFHHDNLTAYLADLKNHDRMQKFVEEMVGLAVIKNHYSAGFDES